MSESVNELIGAFVRMHRRELENKAHAATEYKMNEGRVLMQLKSVHPEGMKVSELSRALFVTSPFVTQLLNQMEESGLIVRKRDAQDRRIVRIGLTDQGLEAARAVYEHFRKLFVGLAGHLGEADSRKLAELLNRTMDYMEKTLPKKG
ncbi:MarR family winged helix-turn-helix transcriptional regulator [Paenibacillus sp. 1P07SE]|uniref:MarR family winged helix-turn-helix transcriptional regulator n=1 Tax=Paenibacillus sp. 1P07SE TaxID=3132209 RepID=UPI0039A5FBA4